MDPIQILPSDLWSYIFSYLKCPDLLGIWKTCSHFRKISNLPLVFQKKECYGIEMVNSADQQESLLTTYLLVVPGFNVFPFGKFVSTSDFCMPPGVSLIGDPRPIASGYQ